MDYRVPKATLVLHFLLLDCREYEIFPTDVDEVDVTDLEAVNNYARVNRPDIIINCVGYSDVAGPRN